MIGAGQRAVPAQDHAGDDVVDGLRALPGLESHPRTQAGQRGQHAGRIRLGEPGEDPFLIAHAPITARLGCPVVHHLQRVVRIGQDLPCEIVQGRGQGLRELLVFGLRERGQCGERLPVLERGVPLRIGSRVRGTRHRRKQKNRHGQTRCAQHEQDLTFKEVGMELRKAGLVSQSSRSGRNAVETIRGDFSWIGQVNVGISVPSSRSCRALSQGMVPGVSPGCRGVTS